MIFENVRPLQCSLAHCVAEGQTPNLKKNNLTTWHTAFIHVNAALGDFGLNSNHTSACYIM